MLSTGEESSSFTYLSASSFSSPLSLHSNPNPRPKPMEEVWKDISLASLEGNPTRPDPASFRGDLTFQDFFAPQQLPPSKNPVPAANRWSPPISPVTILRLNSGIFGSDPMVTNSVLRPEPVWNVPSMNVGGFDAFGTSSSLPVSGNKRLPEPENNAGDRRYKRMIKNREAAARSRARKHAYISELELEVAHLLKENARLRKQQEELCLVAGPQAPKKKSLHRASTAPF